MKNCLRKFQKNHVSSCIKPYSVVGFWIRQKINFSLMKPIYICLRDSRSLKENDVLELMSEDDDVRVKASSVNDED